MGEAQDYQNALEEAYNTHWQNKVLLHPDAERAERLLAQGELPDYEDICREILLVEYPEEVPHETAEDFDELSWNDILNVLFCFSTVFANGVKAHSIAKAPVTVSLRERRLQVLFLFRCCL